MSDGLDIAALGVGVEVGINREDLEHFFNHISAESTRPTLVQVDLDRHGLCKYELAPAVRSIAIAVTEQDINQCPIKGSLHSSNKELS